jgi:hypothetical protein
MLKPQCQAQVGVRPTLMYNALTIPRIVICPHFAEDGSRWCTAHQHLDEKYPV